MNLQVYTFESVHKTIKAEDCLLANKIKCEVIPVPRQLSLSCGQCIRVAIIEAGKCEKLWQNINVQWAKKFLATAIGGGKYDYEECS